MWVFQKRLTKRLLWPGAYPLPRSCSLLSSMLPSGLVLANSPSGFVLFCHLYQQSPRLCSVLPPLSAVTQALLCSAISVNNHPDFALFCRLCQQSSRLCSVLSPLSTITQALLCSSTSVSSHPSFVILTASFALFRAATNAGLCHLYITNQANR